MIEDEGILSNNDITMLYVEYSFLSIPLEETETPFALPKTRGKPLNYNFTKSMYHVDMQFQNTLLITL